MHKSLRCKPDCLRVKRVAQVTSRHSALCWFESDAVRFNNRRAQLIRDDTGARECFAQRGDDEIASKDPVPLEKAEVLFRDASAPTQKHAFTDVLQPDDAGAARCVVGSFQIGTERAIGD